MNKSELVDAVAKTSGLSKADSERALGAIVETITKTLKKGGTVSLVGFGTFKVAKRAAYIGRNPRSGKPIPIKAHKVARFSVGKGLKDAVR